ncbi:MAG: outer membrane beta-barrel protein [Muribaculaceae bacterium]|nr:outer membrane beta-barrel protein [Muribaculaceae bacterium]
MKKQVFALLALLVATCMSATAQYIKVGDWSGSAQLSTGSKRAFGVGFGVQYVPINNFRGDFHLNYYFEVNYDFNLNAHYLIDLYKKRLTLYPLVGVNLSNLEVSKEGMKEESHAVRETHFGVNLGCGLEYRLDYDVALMIEARRSVMKNVGQTLVSAGARLTF